MMDDTQEKQAYLRQEVIDKGYDTGDFVDFLAAEKANGIWNITQVRTSTHGHWQNSRRKSPSSRRYSVKNTNWLKS